jgi:hypothetical protein
MQNSTYVFTAVKTSNLVSSFLSISQNVEAHDTEILLPVLYFCVENEGKGKVISVLN